MEAAQGQCEPAPCSDAVLGGSSLLYRRTHHVLRLFPAPLCPVCTSGTLSLHPLLSLYPFLLSPTPPLSPTRRLSPTLSLSSLSYRDAATACLSDPSASMPAEALVGALRRTRAERMEALDGAGITGGGEEGTSAPADAASAALQMSERLSLAAEALCRVVIATDARADRVRGEDRRRGEAHEA